MSEIMFKVASYALFDALRGLENSNDSCRRIEYSVTKEDGVLVVYAEEKYIIKSNNPPQTSEVQE